MSLIHIIVLLCILNKIICLCHIHMSILTPLNSYKIWFFLFIRNVNVAHNKYDIELDSQLPRHQSYGGCLTSTSLFLALNSQTCICMWWLEMRNVHVSWILFGNHLMSGWKHQIILQFSITAFHHHLSQVIIFILLINHFQNRRSMHFSNISLYALKLMLLWSLI